MSRSTFPARTPRTCASCKRTTRSMRCSAASKAEQTRLADRHGRYVPLALKIAPDLEDAQIQSIADLLRSIAWTASSPPTRRSRERRRRPAERREGGGLSGAPVCSNVDRRVEKLGGACRRVPIIGVGGIMSGADAAAKMAAGASSGPALHRLHLPWSGADRRSRGGDRPGAPRLRHLSYSSKVVECARSKGIIRAAAEPPCLLHREP
jgi:hypothetical protein